MTTASPGRSGISLLMASKGIPMNLNPTRSIFRICRADFIEANYWTSGVVQLVMINLMRSKRRIERQVDIRGKWGVLHLAGKSPIMALILLS